jgi:dolichol-phosphate mannosyltransferase
MPSQTITSTARILTVIPVFGETEKITRVISRFQPKSVTEVCIVLDSPDEIQISKLKQAASENNLPIHIITNPVRKGIGYAIRQGYEYALSHGFEIIVVMAGNGKDDPQELPRLTDPILNHDYDYVQGSRFLPGGRRIRNPFLRRIFTRLFPIIWTWTTGKRCTDVTNGFRAYKTSILQDRRINLWQEWLDKYQLEYYLHYKVLTLGYKFTERPVSKIYPVERRGYTKISPFRDWWQIVGPIVLLKLGARS